MIAPTSTTDVQPFIERLTDHMEELTWLRALVDNLEFCTATNGLKDVAERTFPALRDILRAEAIALVQPTGWADATRTRPTDLEFPLWCGRRVVDRAECAEFLATVAETTIECPFVWNRESAWPTRVPADPPKPIESCVLVAVQSKMHQYGWLLALNRMPRPTGDGAFAISRLGDDEFGTVEASLLESAAKMLATHAANVRLFNEQRALVVNVIRSLINVLDARDSYTCGHSDRVALTGRLLSKRLGQSAKEQEYTYLAGLLHDIGKVGVSDDILLKPGRLTDDEFDKIKEHPERGVRILERFPQFQPILPGVMHHHEAFDGSGYPDGLAGDSIPTMGRILAVVDAYDAITTCRPYRDAKTHDEAIEILRHGAGRQWDPDAIDAFLGDAESFRRLSAEWESHVADVLDGDDSVFDGISDAIDDSALIAGSSSRQPGLFTQGASSERMALSDFTIDQILE